MVQDSRKPSPKVDVCLNRKPLRDSDIIVRLCEPSERDHVLRFIAEMGFNARDAAAWDGLRMVAMTAWCGSRLVGAVPMEPRSLQVMPGRVVPTVHQTTVAVAPDLRGRGIGSRMQQAILAARQRLAPLATVFREQPDSPAYRWYCRNGFSPVMTINAWVLEGQTPGVKATDCEVRAVADLKSEWSDVEALFDRAYARKFGGFVCRNQRPRRQWLEVHPYRSHYTFACLLVRNINAEIVAYALLGIGKLHSQTDRLEIMEHAASGRDSSQTAMLIQQVAAYAHRHGYRPVRWALAAGDPQAEAARRQGFVLDRQFDLLARPLQEGLVLPDPADRRRLWRYHSLDYA